MGIISIIVQQLSSGNTMSWIYFIIYVKDNGNNSNSSVIEYLVHYKCSVCCGQSCVSFRLCAEALTPAPQNVIVFGGWVFKEVIKLRWGHWKGHSSRVSGVPVKETRKQTHTQGRSSEDTGEDGHWQAKEKGLGRDQPCPHTELGLVASRTGRKQFLLPWPICVVFCYGSSGRNVFIPIMIPRGYVTAGEETKVREAKWLAQDPMVQNEDRPRYGVVVN